MILGLVVGPATPDAPLGRGRARRYQLGVVLGQRRLDAVVVDHVEDLFVGGVAGDVAHVVLRALVGTLVGAQVLHAEVDLSQRPPQRPLEIGLGVEEDQGRPVVGHGVGDSGLVVTVFGAGCVGQHVLEYPPCLGDPVVTPAVLREDVDRLAVGSDHLRVTDEDGRELLRHVGGQVDDPVPSRRDVDLRNVDVAGRLVIDLSGNEGREYQ